MFWAFLLCAGLALVFAQLGAYSVWIVLLAGGLKLAFLVIGILVIALLWRKIFHKNS